MNKQFFCGALAIGVLLAGTAMAQKPVALGEAPQVEQIQKRKFDKEHHEKMAKRLADKLNLTNEQQQKAEQIRKSGQAKIKPLLDEMMELRQKIDKERRANMKEFENILNSVSRGQNRAMNDLGGDFISKKDLSNNSHNSQNERHNSEGQSSIQNQNGHNLQNVNKKNKGAENFGQGLFDSEYPNEQSNSDGSFAQPSYKSFTPPAGFVPNEADINQPAIWRKPEFSRSIKLSDD